MVQVRIGESCTSHKVYFFFTRLASVPRFLKVTFFSHWSDSEVKMVLELDDFRDDKGGSAEKIRKNQADRFKDVSLVDKVTLPACSHLERIGEQM